MGLGRLEFAALLEIDVAVDVVMLRGACGLVGLKRDLPLAYRLLLIPIVRTQEGLRLGSGNE